MLPSEPSHLESASTEDDVDVTAAVPSPSSGMCKQEPRAPSVDHGSHKTNHCTQGVLAVFRSAHSVISQYPSTLIVPLVVLAASLGVGIWAVLAAAQSDVSRTQGTAGYKANGVLASIQSQMQTYMAPGQTLGTMVRLFPTKDSLDYGWDMVAHDLLGQISTTNVSIGLAPNGIVNLVSPRTSLVGLNVMLDPYAQTGAFKTIAFGNLTLLGPWDVPPYGVVTVALNPIFISNIPSTITDFGFGPVMTNCGTVPCYNNDTHSRFWGYAAVGISVAALSDGSDPRLQSLNDDNYLYSLRRPASVGNDLGLDEDDDMGNQAIISQSDPLPKNPIMAKIQLPNAVWYLYLSPSRGWDPVWKQPVLAAVIIISFILATCVFMLMMSRRQHQMLLTALLPKQVIAQLRSDQDFFKTAAILDSGTPAEKILSMMGELMHGRIPAMQDIMLVRTAIAQSSNIYQPMNLHEQLQASLLDADVTQALMQQLGNAGLGGSPRRIISDQVFLPSSTTELVPGSRTRSFSTAALTAGQKLLGKTDDSAFDSLATALVALVTERDKAEPASLETDSQAMNSHISLSSASMEHVAYTAVPAPIMEEVEKVLATCNNWEFDAFKLRDVTNGHELSTLGYYIMHQSQLIQRFKLKGAYLARFLRSLEEGYGMNPYHNKTHAADVLQTMHVILCQSSMIPGYADPLTQMACYLSTVMHDYDHPGLTNDYLVNSIDALALLYNDKAPLENHHLAASFSLMRQPGKNFLAHLPKQEFDKLRKMVIELVLCTDMKQHFTITSQFSSVHRLQAAPNMSAKRNNPDRTSLEERSSDNCAKRHGGRTDEHSKHTCIPIDDAERLLSLQVALKCADVGHIAEGLEVHLRWVSALEEEFFKQGDKEKLSGLPVSPLFDRNKPGVTKSQVGFFDFVVIPLFHNFAKVFPGVTPMVKCVMSNYKYWTVQQQLQQRVNSATQGNRSSPGLPPPSSSGNSSPRASHLRSPNPRP